MDRLSAASIRVPGAEVRVVERCTSTSALLRGERTAGPLLLAAELQTAGRGRHGRRWRSARGAGATFSIRRHVACEQRELAGLSIALGISSARTLRGLGARGVTLKWPNDLMVKRRKLGGILVESWPAARAGTAAAARLSAPASVVIVGIGINCRAQPRLAARLGRGVAALDEVLRRPASRNALIGAVARGVLRVLADWERTCAPPLEKAA
ncbi:MAG: biotin--[acetyl-CoA-carboxylase] ligase [Burkholderiales bacterium]|nr:biotin--[acetyl-CoA-carboxylase] ligase [Burkholderiales bacterium]